MTHYEVTTIVADEATQNPAPDLIATFGGTIIREDEIGTRKFAYPIGKLTNGVYARFVIELEPSQVNELDAALRRDKAIVRHLIVLQGRESTAPAPTKVEMSDADIAALGDATEMQAAEEKAKAKATKKLSDEVIESDTTTETPAVEAEEVSTPVATVEPVEETAAATEQPTEDVTETDQAAIKNDSKVDEATRQAALDEKLKSILGK